MKVESPAPPAWSFVCVAVDTLPGFSVRVHVLPEQVPPAAPPPRWLRLTRP
ncbi:MAG: hypothetical protein ACRENE_06605 [Polyangiaceae bacterium]